MSKYNKYINNFANEAEYEVYIDSSIAEVPNTALIDDTGKMIYTKILPNNYVMFGTTKGTQDFMIGSSSSESSNADCIHIHVVVEDDSGVNKMYVAPEDVLKMPKYFYSSYNSFGSTEGKKIISLSKWKIGTSNIVHLKRMFDMCSSLKSLDLSALDTSQATSMEYMFQSCSSLTSLDLSSFNTSKVTSMYGMFSVCSSLKSIDLSALDTSQTNDISSMFHYCSSLVSLDLSKFDTSKVTNMYGVFSVCSSLTSLDLSSFNTSNVTTIAYMFNNCSKLTTLNLSSFDTSKVTDMYNMFYNCNKINKLYLSSIFFNSTSLNTYDFSALTNWTDTESLATFVEAITAHDGTGKTVILSSKTKNALTTEQKTAITNAGWTIS